MKEYTTDKIRNVVLVGHQGSGKTSLVEAFLYNTGVINRMGSIGDQNTVSDWDEEERARGMSINTSLVPIEFEDHKINILDTPGYTDFQGEMKNAIRVADAVFVVVSAVSGVEVGTELAWEYARVFQQPIIVIINKIDRENASYANTMTELRESFPKYNFVPVTMPIGEQEDLRGVAGTLTQKAYFGVGDERTDLPDEMADTIEAAHLEIVEAAAEADDDLMQKYFDEGELTYEEVRDGMRKASRSHLRRTVPVFVASATENIGIYPLMEAMLRYTSAPSVRRVRIERAEQDDYEYITAPQSDEKPLAAYVFKTSTDKYGTLNYFRIFSGKVTANSRNLNTTTGTEERFSSLLTVRGNKQIEVDVLHAGDIGAVAKLTDTYTGDTFADQDQGFRIVKPDFPDPLYMVGILPKSQADTAKLGSVLTTLCNNDLALRWRQDDQTRQIVLEGMGEIHINTVLKKAEALGVGIELEMPRVPMRESINGEAEATYRHKKQSGGAGQFGEVTLRVEPTDADFIYETNIFGGAISQSFLPSIEKGIRQVLTEGVIAGYPVIGVKVVVFDGKEHPVDSKDIAFQIAGREAFKQAFADAKPVLQEPIMDVSVTIPETMMGDVMSDLTTRRGRVQGMDSEGRKSIINAQVPLSEMLRYGTDLRSMTGGRGLYTMTFSHYEKVPANVQEDVIAQSKVAEQA